MSALRPKTYSPRCDACVLAVPGGAASMAVTASAARMATIATSLRIDPPRRTAEQQDEQSVDGEEEEEHRELPDLRRVRRGVPRQADEVPQHVERPGRRRHGPGHRR